MSQRSHIFPLIICCLMSFATKLDAQSVIGTSLLTEAPYSNFVVGYATTTLDTTAAQHYSSIQCTTRSNILWGTHSDFIGSFTNQFDGVNTWSQADPTASGSVLLDVNSTYIIKSFHGLWLAYAGQDFSYNPSIAFYSDPYQFRFKTTNPDTDAFYISHLWAGSLPSPTGSIVTHQRNIDLGVTYDVIRPIVVLLNPSSFTLMHSQSLQFTPTVDNVPAGGKSSGVNWSMYPSSSATTGSISSTGLYTAPLYIPNLFSVTITATSIADPTKTATATVNLQPVNVSVSLQSYAADGANSYQCIATVTGAPNPAVVWRSQPGSSINKQTGLFSATPGNWWITATSVEDPSKSAMGWVMITPAGPPPPPPPGN